MFEFRAMSAADVPPLEMLMRREAPEYLRYFTAFAARDELSEQQARARKDQFFVLLKKARLAGFFCLRGLDAGYERPSFGVYVASKFANAGAGRLALQYALEWCEKHRIPAVMLKVSDEHQSARKLYESAGFGVVGICPDTGNLMMEKRLS